MTTPPSTLRADLERLAACLFEMSSKSIDNGLHGRLNELGMAAHMTAKALPPAPAPCAPFKVGDRIRIQCADSLRNGRPGEVRAILIDPNRKPYRVCFDDLFEDWFRADELEPLAPAPEIAAGLSEDDARWLDNEATNLDVECMEAGAEKMRTIASRIRHALAMQSDSHQRRCMTANQRDKALADLATARAENERIAKERDHFACLHDMAMKKRDQFLAERDAARAEAARAEKERARWKDEAWRKRVELRNDRAALESKLAEAEVTIAQLEAFNRSGGLQETIQDRDRLRVKLEATEQVLATCRSDSDQWRDWAETKLPMVEWYSDGHARQLLDQKLAAKSLPARESVEWVARWLRDNAQFSQRDAHLRLRGRGLHLDEDDIGSVHLDAARELDAHAATLPAAPSPGTAFTRDDLRQLDLEVRYRVRGSASAEFLRGLHDRIAQLVPAAEAK